MILDNHIIRHTDFERIYERVSYCHHSKKSGLKPRNLKLFGVSGVGKSFLLKFYTSCHLRFDAEDRTIIPVLYIVVPSKPSESALYEEILTALGDPFPSTGNLRVKKRKIITLFKNCKVELLILDEIQHYLDRGKLATHAAAADSLKVLIDQLEISTVFAGAPRAIELFRVNTQLRSRFKTTARLAPFSIFHPEKTNLFRKLAKALMKQTNFSNVTFFDQAEHLERLFYATDGILRNVADLLGDAAEIGKRSGENTISFPLLAQIYGTWLAGNKHSSANPFSGTIERRRLTLKNEPFEPSALDGDNHSWEENGV